MLQLACGALTIAALLLVATAGRWCGPGSAHAAAVRTVNAQGMHDGQHDFDLYVGKWRSHNRRLLHPMTSSAKWEEFDGTSVARTMWDGRANMDEFEADTPSGHIEGMTVRLYNASTRQWSIYLSGGESGAFSMPASVGHFTNGRGEFYDHEQIDGKPVLIRLLWQFESPKSCHWEQAFSINEGKTWVTNWTMDSTKMEGPAL